MKESDILLSGKSLPPTPSSLEATDRIITVADCIDQYERNCDVKFLKENFVVEDSEKILQIPLPINQCVTFYIRTRSSQPTV